MPLFTRQRKTHKDHTPCMHTLLPMQLAILLMVLYIASAGLAIIPITGRFSSAPLTTLIIGGIFPFQFACVIIMEIIHLCIRTRRKRTSKCFLTWVRYRLYGYSVYIQQTNYISLFIEWLTIYICACTYIEIAIIDTLITSHSYWVYNVPKWRLRVALEST